jgi:hypothetical protein
MSVLAPARALTAAGVAVLCGVGVLGEHLISSRRWDGGRRPQLQEANAPLTLRGSPLELRAYVVKSGADHAVAEGELNTVGEPAEDWRKTTVRGRSECFP